MTGVKIFSLPPLSVEIPYLMLYLLPLFCDLVLPHAEQMRRKQMLADSFSAPISIEKTVLYYNNTYTSSVERLSANTMENALFSQAIADKMLSGRRIRTICYMLMWFIIFAVRHEILVVLHLA